jgi:hypothetical protein
MGRKPDRSDGTYCRLAFALLLNIFGWYCPLTYLEVWLREKQDPSQVYAAVHRSLPEKLVYIQLPRNDSVPDHPYCPLQRLAVPSPEKR